MKKKNKKDLKLEGMGRIWKVGGERVNKSEHIVQNPQRNDMNLKKTTLRRLGRREWIWKCCRRKYWGVCVNVTKLQWINV